MEDKVDTKFMKHVPLLLIYARLLAGILIFVLSFTGMNSYPVIAVVLFSFGLLTDIFDGIIARQLQISTQQLRRLDSTIDQIFFILIAAAVFVRSPQFFYDNYVTLIILFGLELLAYVVCFIKFKKEIATHSIAAKMWTLILFSCLIQLLFSGSSTVLYQVCFYAGILTRLEIIGIILLLRQWTNDVPSIYHAVLLRKGKPIKKHKLFNG